MLHLSDFITRRVAFGTCAVLIGALFFGYYPLLQLGALSGFYVDIALLYIIATVAVLSNVIIIYRHRFTLWRSWSWRLLLILTVYITLSCLWSTNTLRGLVTAAFMWLIVGIVSMMVVQTPNIIRRSKRITLILSITLALSITWALWQIIGDALDVAPSLTLLPFAYSSEVFGIARPTAFALEPQFFASLLIAPLCWFVAQTLRKASLLSVASLIVIATMLVLTLSRGGIFAACIALVIIFFTTRTSLQRRLQTIGSLGIAILLSFTVIYGVASLNQRDPISGYSALRGTINHLSLGIISLPSEPAPSAQPSIKSASSQPEPKYVQDSTTSRVSMSSQATSLWLSAPQTMLFGVGIGAFGVSAHDVNPDIPISAIVNNNYLEVLVETGAIGLMLFIGVFSSLIITLWHMRQYTLAALITAFLLQWCFFSGNANILHVWVITGFAIEILQNRRKPQAA